MSGRRERGFFRFRRSGGGGGRFSFIGDARFGQKMIKETSDFRAVVFFDGLAKIAQDVFDFFAVVCGDFSVANFRMACF